jgi:putative endonuclease
MASQRNGTLYIGISGNLPRRVYEHKHGLVPGFSKKHNTKMLVYTEEYSNVHEALKREKQLKKWNRQWKLNLIEKTNPDWMDLYDSLISLG